ncbi:MAG: type I glyceraldehyde-3-phosphate dehydrogenase, partial [Candidatus Amoebophilus sp.]
KFTSKDAAQKHIKSGAKAVLISAPAIDPDVTIIPGVNYQGFNIKEDKIVSLGSCTTNALVPMLYVIEKNFGIEHAAMSTTHAYTNSQALLDSNPKSEKIRRSRAAALNIVPSTTGAMKVADKILTSLQDKLIGQALRVPVGVVSIVDLVCVVKSEKINKEEINKVFEKEAQSELKDILKISHEPLVSSDYMQDPHSVIIDGELTQATGPLIKVWGWYDNEWGYSSRLKDFLIYVLNK